MAFVDSETYKNLQNAFQGELITGAKYEIYGDIARREGYIQISNIYELTARNDIEHAKIWLRALNNGELPTTLTNLEDSYNEEIVEMYNQYSKTARAEGYTDIANLFEAVGLIERHHNYRFQRLAENLITNTMYCKDNSVVWICLICGNLVWNECAPEICPVCGYPQGYYQLNCENY